jgi:outer membrane protein assembly factor BamB
MRTRVQFILLSLASLLLSITVAHAATNGSWVTYHGDFALTGNTTVTLPADLSKRWTYKTTGPVRTTPVSDGKHIYVMTDTADLISLTMRGKERWKRTINNESFSAPLILAQALLIVGSDSGFLYAFETTTGFVKWKLNLDASIQGSATFLEDTQEIVVLSQGDGSIHAIDPIKGKKVWTIDGLARCDGSPAAAYNRIVFGSCAAALHVFTSTNRSLMHNVELDAESQVAGGSALDKDLAFFSSRSGNFVCANTSTGTIKWQNTNNADEAFSTPAFNDTSVIFSSDNGNIYHLLKETGKQLWAFDTLGIPSSPIISGNKVIVSSDGSLYMIDLESGNKLWSQKITDDITSPAVAGNQLLVGTDDGRIISFGSTSKKKIILGRDAGTYPRPATSKKESKPND